VTARTITIGATLGARAARTRRACVAWTDANDAHGPLDVLAAKATEVAEQLGRDLTVAEVHAVCSAAFAAFQHAEAQRLAEEAIAGARETERLEYLAKRARDYRLTGGQR
jgi:hypothetical protein